MTSSTSYFLPEWNILSKLFHLDCKNDTNTTNFCVPSHQDDKVLVNKIPLEVQLNIEAENLATQRQLCSTRNYYSPLYSTTKVHLLIEYDRVTRNICESITTQYQEMVSYYLHQYNWTYCTFQSIH